MSIKEYNELLEDLDDLAVAAERREELVVSHDDFTAELKRGALIQDGMAKLRPSRIEEDFSGNYPSHY